ncbi:hypothetical protein GGX14DRAFT_425135 [Mycena pura]|uniref:Serine/threonine-protein kinase Tel1 n=1 Tax=Mycena pura TaxID=153505 RepID=A0AAD6YN83_9AGAR|nr:hypothetical protein GGX14DRAFT_425135 [Mycena pura]
MSKNVTVRVILQQLKSEKITERQQGLPALRTLFTQDKVIANFHISEDGVANPNTWLIVFQALFEAVFNEKVAYLKQMGKASTTVATARRRLTDAANTVRWLTERVVQFLNNAVAQALLDHLYSTMIHKSELMEPVALDYIKALRCLLEWTPHLDRIDVNKWVPIVEMAFNVLLGDPIRKPFSDDPADSITSPTVAAAEGDDSDAVMENEDESDISVVVSPKKRRGRAHPSEPRPKRGRYVPSQEQNELVPVLCLLLGSPSAPLLLQGVSYLPSSILRRLQTFFDIYSADASLYHDYLLTVLSTLSHLSLNRKDCVVRFARESWDSLVSLWGTKNKGMKECLVSVLRILFPFLTADHNDTLPNVYDWSQGIAHLWRLLDGEAESRWGVGGLSLDCIRLELDNPEERTGRAFVAWTFRSGFNFDSVQALAWAILELQADCAEKLFQHSENIHTPSQHRSRRTESPIVSLLRSLEEQKQSHILVYHLQTLLFFIDRHWPVLHDTLQESVFSTLKRCIPTDNPLLQSWTFLCLAAIAHSDAHPQAGSRHAAPIARDWDTIWAHAIRRANVPSISRAACHVAYVLLLYSHSHSPSSYKLALTPQHVLVDIESLAKDLDVQGPPFPYDSVCAFLSQALKVASQDVRLHRRQCEDKALTWIVDCWSIRNSSNLSLYSIRDVMLLLETICGLSKRSDLFCRILLPECLIAATLVEQAKTKIIRDYLLAANLPQFRKADDRSSATMLEPPFTGTMNDDRRHGDDPVEESPRERRISNFLSKSLEALASELEIFNSLSTFPSAEKARHSLDWAVAALSFEAVLTLNGTRSNRRTVQAACKVMLLVVCLLKDSRWTDSEKASVLLALEPLTSTGETEDGDVFNVALSPPDIGSGIKAQTLQTLLSNRGQKENRAARRIDLQRMICKSTDVQDGFSDVARTLRDVLQILIGGKGCNDAQLHTRDVDFDGVPAHATETTKQKAATVFVRYIAEVCIAFLTIIPILRSESGEPTNDNELTELVLSSNEVPDETSLLLYQIFLRHVKEKTLALSKPNFDSFLDQLAEKFLRNYYWGRSESAQMLTVHFLDATLPIWCAASGERGLKAREICGWLSTALRAGQQSRTHIRSWKIRDALARFYDRYLMHDPSEASWYNADEDEDTQAEGVPSRVLQQMNTDDDIRVRFRAGVLVAHLFAVGRTNGRDVKDVYRPIFESYPRDLNLHENMLTRLLSLGNIMVVSSAVRRGAYWHLLEASFYDTQYTRHTEAILVGVSQRLGLPKFAALFEAYSSQLAYTIKASALDFLRLPPRLLGYHDRKDCAEANFLAFTPTNLVAEAQQQAAHMGRKLFTGHCKVIQKPVSEGIRDCFADVTGYQILQTLSGLQPGQSMPTEELKSVLLEKTMYENSPADFDDVLLDNVDGVVAWLVRTLGDQDFRPGGPIVQALEAVDPTGTAAETFRALVRYRNMDDFETHEPNAPAFPSPLVLQALSWFDAFVSDTNAKATAYHVTHELFAEIQRSSLVNEQLRLLNALCLWIAFRNDSFTDPTLLHVLLRGATSLMTQSDLARAAQSILEWVFERYRTARADNPRFPDVLIRICCCANDYARPPSGGPLNTLGRSLRTWIDGQVFLLSTAKSKTLKASVIRALSAWPHTPSPQLAELVNTITSVNLSTVLSDPSIVSNKFRLVRRLRDHAVAEDRDAAQFADTDFWRLRECIPPSEQLHLEDIDAFASLLEIYEGGINSFASEQPSIHGRYRRDASSGSSPKNWIVHGLLGMLESNDSSQVHVAYRTLRSAMSVSPPNIAAHLPSEYQDELRYIQAYKRTPKTRPPRELGELMSSDAYLDAIGDFPRWVSMIATLLSDILSTAEPFYAQLTPIFQSDTTFTEHMLPVLVHCVLETERCTVQGRTISNLPCRKTISDYFSAVLKHRHASIPCVRSIVDIVLHLRNFTPKVEKDLAKTDPKKADALAYDKWLAIDYTLLARNSITCGAYTTSLLFLELAVEYTGNAPREENATEETLYEIYAHIDEPDGFYGIKTRDPNKFIVKRLHHEKQWNKAFQFHSAALEAGITDAEEADGLLQAFHSFGFNHLAMDTLHKSSFGIGTTIKSDMSYRLGWRTETWDLPEQKGEGNPGGSSLYNALRAVYRARSLHVIQEAVRSSIFEEMQRLRVLGSENLTEIRDAAQTLMCLNQVSQWFEANGQHRLGSRQADMSEWTRFINLAKGFEFADFENIMATRISLVRSVRRKEERQQIGTMVSPFCQCLLDVEKQCLIRVSQVARDAQQNQIALNSVIRAQALERSRSLEVSVEFAHVLRLHKEDKLAVQFLKELDLTHLLAPEKAVILARLGTWMAEACLDNPTDIASRYFEPATTYINDFREKSPSSFTASHALVYLQYASFAEHQYKAIKNSPDAIRWKVYVDRKTQEIQQRQTQGGHSAKVLKDAQTLLKADQESFQKHNSARQTFLAHAIEMHSRALEASDAFDGDGAIRLCSLWFENFDETEFGFQDNVRSALDRTPSHKLVFLAHQLSARLSKTSEPMKNQANLQSVVLRMCAEHPFHSLYQVYCLLPYGQQQPATHRRQSGRHNSPGMQSTSRSEAATEIFNRLRGDPRCDKRVKDVEIVASACLEWAKHKIMGTELDPKQYKGSGNKPRNIPAHLSIRKIEGIDVPVLTYPTPLDLTSKYDQCVSIDKFETTFETAGGVNLPKICKCIGTDGARYKQLFKGEGNDDLRQDAVMEQVFSLCNTVLSGDRETHRRRLSVKGYKIVPLGAQAGVLEFVANTTPMQGWLVQTHIKYNVNDLSPRVASDRILKTWEEHHGRDPEKQLKCYLDVRKRFHPVLRHFFTEKHKTPMAWFAMRLAYTRSVATTSIVGHVLGLGDRHGSNILLDMSTGEMVHIDLGIAFDQGKLLNVPEQVPFRMTPDIIDGMGAAGTQGVFQRCAEETLRVLREGSEVIMTVLEVFKHDPLHSWTASEMKLKNVQDGAGPTRVWGGMGMGGIGIDMASGTADEAADRALTGVARKLDKLMSVEYTVNELIAEATDAMRLASMWYGWGAIY